MNRLIIGVFKIARSGGWEGEIKTLLASARVRFVPNDDRANANAPAFRVMLGSSRIGDAWEAQWGGEHPRSFWRVSLDDPFLPTPISAALFPEDDGASAQLVWTRPLKNEEKAQGRGQDAQGAACAG
jgi:uncharacterized protein (DUF736 family)